jgi:hypothetical protein
MTAATFSGLHEDYGTLRRLLVDQRLLERGAGAYRRRAD